MPIHGTGRSHTPSSHVPLHSVRHLWLNISEEERYLLLEDMDTGDILIPLIYMKLLYEVNYSRKLSCIKYRIITVTDQTRQKLGMPFVSDMYWHWAFESPHSVKLLVRKLLGEDNTPQGHLRLVLLPIVYNALAQKDSLRNTKIFRAMSAALARSSYYPLLRHYDPNAAKRDGREKSEERAIDKEGEKEEDAAEEADDAEEAAEAAEAKRAKQAKAAKGREEDSEARTEPEKEKKHSVVPGALARQDVDFKPAVMAPGENWVPESESMPTPLFQGPHDLRKTFDKYVYASSHQAGGGSEAKARGAGVVYSGMPPLTRGMSNPHSILGKREHEAEHLYNSDALSSVEGHLEALLVEVKRMKHESDIQIQQLRLEMQMLKQWVSDVFQRLVTVNSSTPGAPPLQIPPAPQGFDSHSRTFSAPAPMGSPFMQPPQADSQPPPQVPVAGPHEASAGAAVQLINFLSAALVAGHQQLQAPQVSAPHTRAAVPPGAYGLPAAGFQHQPQPVVHPSAPTPSYRPPPYADPSSSAPHYPATSAPPQYPSHAANPAYYHQMAQQQLPAPTP
mmetsp:Transcript_14207/g.48975  ORF Transcript_14207/g.48975 Transcript_14207/m.48975 type:complete len:562 (-) Transcript_14207:193-1878(-)